MDKILEQYFDFGVMFDSSNFDKVIDGFVFTIKLSIIAGIALADLGPRARDPAPDPGPG